MVIVMVVVGVVWVVVVRMMAMVVVRISFAKLKITNNKHS